MAGFAHCCLLAAIGWAIPFKISPRMQQSIIARSSLRVRCQALSVKPAFDPVGTPARVHWPQTSRADARIFTLRNSRQERVKRMTPGTELMIVKEFNHPDTTMKGAVVVCTTGGVKLGYVPKELAAHFQAGVYTAAVDAVGWEPTHSLLDVTVSVTSFEPLLTSNFGLQFCQD